MPDRIAAVVAGRPLPDFVGQEETSAVPDLDTREQEALIERLSGQEVTLNLTYSWPESVKEAVKRPLFTTLLALDLRTRDIRNPALQASCSPGLSRGLSVGLAKRWTSVF